MKCIFNNNCASANHKLHYRYLPCNIPCKLHPATQSVRNTVNKEFFVCFSLIVRTVEQITLAVHPTRYSEKQIDKNAGFQYAKINQR